MEIEPQILSNINAYAKKKVADKSTGNFKGSLRRDMNDKYHIEEGNFLENKIPRATTNHQEGYYLSTASKLSAAILNGSISKGVFNIIHILWKKHNTSAHRTFEGDLILNNLLQLQT